MDMAKNATYFVGENSYEYDFIAAQTNKHLTGEKDQSDPSLYLHYSAYWSNVYMLMRKFSPERYQTTLSLLEDRVRMIKSDIFKLLNGSEMGLEDRDNCKEMILMNFYDKGFEGALL